ncbi:MAG TPA: hypothetical protein VMH80_20560 [Bryobacteraceae bacterium]|nr:hypothetical protein [Bryobacteraceae bacterium]
MDGSWVLGLNMAHAARMVFGRDIVFTYGPLGYLALPIFPGAEPWAVFCFAWGFATVTAYALWRLRKRVPSWSNAFALFAILWVCSVAVSPFPGAGVSMAATVLTLAIAAGIETNPWLDVGLLFLVGAVAALTKLNLAVAPTLIALYFTGLLLWRARSASLPWKPALAAVLVWPAAFLTLYGLADGTLQPVVTYFRNSEQIIGGYSDAMAIAGPLWVTVLAVASCVVLFIVVPIAGGEFRRMAPACIPAAIVSFLAFKEAMVREDGHCVGFQFELAMAALLFGVLAATTRSRIVVGLFAILSIGAGFIVQTQVWPELLPADVDRLTGRVFLSSWSGFLNWSNTVNELSTATEKDLASKRSAEVQGAIGKRRVTAFPTEIDSIRANHLHWQPLPIFQAYSAYTPTLDKLDAEALSAVSGPEAVLLSWSMLDGHQPFFETPQTWQAVLDWYDVQLVLPGSFVLQRRAAPRFDPAIPAGSAQARWGEQIVLPPVADDEVLLMETGIRETTNEAARRTLFRSVPVWIDSTLRSGRSYRGRVVRMNLPDAAIASDWPQNLKDLRPLFEYAGSPRRDRVAAIRFETEDPRQFDSVIRIRWSRRRFHAAPASASLH